MPILIVVTLAAQGICIYHAMRNGNDRWIWILVMVPGLGCAAYAVSFIAPELFGSFGVQRAARKVLRSLDPERDRRTLGRNLEIVDSHDNRRALAAESLSLGDFSRATDLYRSCLVGLYEYEPLYLLGLAQAQFGSAKFAESKATLELLIKHNPEFRSEEGHLLYARSLAALGSHDAAIAEFEVLKAGYHGEQARYCYAELLITLGREQQAKPILQELIKRSELAPKHYQKAQREWLKKAEVALNSLS